MNVTVSQTANRTRRLGPTFGYGPSRPHDAELARLKNRLLEERLREDTEPRVQRLARLEATEAEALSWLTPFPLLVFPALMDEKLTGVQRYAARQRRLSELSRSITLSRATTEGLTT